MNVNSSHHQHIHRTFAEPPKLQEEEEEKDQLTLPSFEEPPRLQEEREENDPPLSLPRFEETPRLEEEDPLSMPCFEPVDAPEFNPIVRQLTTLAKTHSYEEIVDQALRFGTIGDLRMLKNHSALKPKYLHALYDHLIAEFPYLLPKKSAYTPLMANSEEQIKQWENFIDGLINVKGIEQLAALFPVNRLLEPRPYTAYVDNEQTLGLLRFKEFAHRFFSKILKQEKKSALKKDLRYFEQVIYRLESHIQDEYLNLRLNKIRNFADLDFSQHEIRTPLKQVDSNPVYTVDQVNDHQLALGLNAIQQWRVSASQLREFTNRVLSFPDRNMKGHYLIELARVYAKFQTLSALKMAVSWIDQAYLTVTDQTLKLKCYEIRGALWLEMNEVRKKTGMREMGALRKGIDLSYRDFHASLELDSPAHLYGLIPITNYVRTAQNAKSTFELEESIRVDNDYAEAHYNSFLKRFEQFEQWTPRKLPPQFNDLPTDSLFQLKRYLQKRSGEANQFKLTFTTGTIWVKIEGGALWIHSTDKEALYRLLTSRIKKVEAVEEKFQFAQQVTKEKLHQDVLLVDNTTMRLAEIEQCLEEFRSFELSAFYKTSLCNRAQKQNDILSRLDYDLLLALLNMHEKAIRCYERLKSKENDAAALAHTAQGIGLCDRLLTLFPGDKVLKEKKLNFLLKKGTLYKQLELIHNEAETWEQALLYAKQENPRFFNPSLHFNLACAYQKENRLEEAKEQLFSLINSPWATKKKPLLNEAEKKLKELKKGNVASQDPVELMTLFKERNILDECLQILRANAQANSSNIWETFIQQINQTTTLKDFFEVLFSSIHLSKTVTKEHLLLLAQVSNLRFKDLKELDQIKLYALDALAAYKEIEAREEDLYLEELEKAKQNVKEAQAFFNLKKALQEELRKGDNIRPGSQMRFKLDTLLGQLKTADGMFILETLRSCFNRAEFNNPDLNSYFQKENLAFLAQELTGVINEALESSEVSSEIKENVQIIRGRNLFLHKILEKIDKTVKEVHILGVNVYIDTSFTLNGINLGIGGKYVEFLKDQNGAKLKIDLSGSKGKDGPEVSSERAMKGAHPGQPGGKGDDGKDATGGYHGGDFCISADKLEGAGCVERIYLNGGEGGKGSDGQPGGDGADGIKGEEARKDIQPGDLAHGREEYADFRRGKPGTQGGEGGRGGSEGAGGMRGTAGRYLIENKDISYEAKQPDIDGENGKFGLGGQPGTGGALGDHHVKTRRVKYFSFFKIQDDRKERTAPKMKWDAWDYDWNRLNADDWVIEGANNDDTRIKGVGNKNGKTVEEQGKKKHEQPKNKFQEQLFTSNLAKHLSQESSENRASAFDEVTNQLAVVKDTEEILKEQCEEKKKKLKDIDNLQETTKQILNQTRHEQRAQTEKIRIAAFTGGKTVSSNSAQEIAYFLKHPEKDQNLLRYIDYPEAIHKALYAVNASKGKNMHALAHLVEEMGKLEKPDFEKLEEIVKKVAPDDDGMDHLVKAAYKLKGNDNFKAAVTDKNEQVKKIQNRKAALEKAYESERKTLLMHIGIHQFFLRDHLLYKNFGSLTATKQRWLEARLNQKVHGFAKQVYKKEKTKTDSFYTYGLQILESATGKEALAKEKNRLRSSYITLRRHKEWLVEHLTFLTQEMIEKKNIGQLYQECSKQWAALPGDSAGQNDVLEEPVVEQAVKWGKLEAHAKRLYDSGVKGDLQKIESLDNEGLAEIYTALAAEGKEPSEILKKLKTANWQEVYAWRKIAQGDLLSSYLEKRHIILIREKCVASLMKNDYLKTQKKRMEDLLLPFLQKVNSLYQFHPLISYDFLQIALKVIEANFDLTLECLDKKAFEALEEKVINQAVEGPPLKRTTDHLIQFFSTSNNEDNLKGCLFLLLNRNLKYAELVELIEIAKRRKLSEEIVARLNQKAEGEKSKFDQQWEAVLERGKAFDQLMKKGEGSIDFLLRHIASAAALLTNDEKIALLDQMIEIVSKKGPYASLKALKALVARLGSVPGAHGYNLGLEALIVRGEKSDLASLWMKMEISDEMLLQKAMVAVNHIPFTADELIAVYRKVFPLKKNELLLDQIKTLLCLKLGEETNKIIQQKELLEKQKAVLEEFSNLVRGTQILHPEQHVAKFSVWILLLNCTGDEALKVFKDKFQNSKSEEALQAFDAHLALKRGDLTTLNQLIDRIAASDQAKLDRWIKFLNYHFAIQGEGRAFYKKALDVFQTSEGRDDFNHWMNKKYSGAIKNDDAFQQLLKQLEKKDQAEEELENRYWLGSIPFSSEKDEPTILTLLEGKEMTIATRKLFKRKFDFFMVHDDCTQVREKVQAAKKKEHEELKARVGSMQSWLLTEKISPLELEKHYKEKVPLPPRVQKEQKIDKAPIRKFLAELNKRIEAKSITDEDCQALYLIRESHAEFKEESNALESKLIALKDQKENAKQEAIKNFLDVLPFTTKEDHALHACFAMMGEEVFLPLLTHLTHYVKAHPKLHIEMVQQLFWVLPRLKDQSFIFDVIANRLPENWAVALLERHCMELLKPSVQEKFLKFSNLKLEGKQDKDKDWLIVEELKKKEHECSDFVKQFQSSLKALIEMPDVGLPDKEVLLRLFAERLALKNEKEMEFSIEEFSRLIGPDYLLKKGVIKKLFQSSLSNQLAQPLFQTFKYVITYTWIKTMLAGEPHEQRLIEALFTIDTVRKEQAMRSVVVALSGNFLTPSVSDAVAHFADKSWELDEKSLEILKNRQKDGAWYAEIENYTREKRSKVRDLKTVVSLMADEKEGINSSIQKLLGEDPQLVEDIKDIHKYFEEVKGWSQEQVTKWAIENRSETFSDDEKRVKMGIALISRANQLIGSYTLYDTQYIALWLMLRKKTENRGRIAQMFTGEGKSITFAGLAILRAMNKSYVDVITTSYVLAMRDAKGQAKLFKLFNLTVSNNCDLECEADEKLRKTRYFDKKPIDIVYGEVSCFERDLLLTEFHGKEIIHSDRLTANRSALIDEVDGLFLDNAGMVLYLSHNVDSLRFVTRIFEQIWVLANHNRGEDDRAVAAIMEAVNKKIKAEELLLPSYQVENARYIEMKEIVERKLPLWIRSALYAKKLKIDKEYIITEQVIGGKKKKNVTVMDIGTGVEQFALKWSHGLHQFLQLKHALELGDESLKAVFLSNYFFFKRYGSNLYGLSGTLGSDIEQKNLDDLYQVDLCKIPRAKGEKYLKAPAQVAGSWQEWTERINKSVDKQIKERQRAVLIISEAVEEVLYLQKHLKEQYPGHYIYTSSLQNLPFLDPDNRASVRPGDLIIATNLAGRGTDLLTDPLLEAHGGLHVILSYLPKNIRIEDQAFGRTARQGNEGSGGFIIMDPDLRSIDELCAIRNLEEKTRLENIAKKEVKKIEFEEDLLRGFEGIEGFESVLKRINGELQNELPFYRQAQIDSLKNRWAFWLDHMDEKISLVYTLGREGVTASYKEFLEGVKRDFQAGGFRLIKEPAELIKLGGEYRREKMWTYAEGCYREAAKDPHYDYARYYMAFCSYAQHPDPTTLKKQVKKAAHSIKNEIKDLQNNAQNIVDIAERRRREFGEPSHGNPYKQRTDEKLQVWSIFLSSIESALGGSLSGDKVKSSSFVKDEEEGTKILESLGDNYKKARLSKKWDPKDIPAMFKQALEKLKGDPDRSIDKQKLKECCGGIITQESALRLLGGPQQTVYKFAPLPPSFKGWPTEYTEPVKFVLSEFVHLLAGDTFEKHEEMIAKLQEMQKEHPILNSVDMRRFFSLLPLEKDYKIDVSRFVKKEVQITSNEKLMEAFTYETLPPELQNALLAACPQKNGDYLTLRDTLYLSELNLPKTTADASEMLWTLLESQRMIKPGKIKVLAHVIPLAKQMEGVKERVKGYFSGINNEDLTNAVDSIFNLIDNSIGMIHKLHDKKSTAEFSAIIRKCFHDHHTSAPEGLSYFLELGLEAIADLVEKKDPPAWYELATIIALGVLQMVAGCLIKAFVPLVGEFISSALMSTGMDDVMFAISSAVSGEFSWADFAKHKEESLKNAIISSAIGTGISFGVNAASVGIEKAYTDVAMLTDVEKMAKASKLTNVAFTFNLGSYIGQEIGKNFLAMGISQVASRGLEGMSKVIASSYENDVKRGIESTVNNYWPQVAAQADALYEKCGQETTDMVRKRVEIVLKKLHEEKGLESVVRESKHFIPQASSMIGDKGWSTFFSYFPDIAKLGISIPKLCNLADDNVHALMREIRKAVEIKEAKQADNLDKNAFHLELEKVKEEYTKQLIDAYNQTLSSAVYAPLVSMGTNFLVQKGKDSFFPETEEQQIARSAKTLSEIADVERNPNEAFYDKPLRNWRGATNEVKELTDKELEESAANGGGKIKHLKLQYGSLLKVYKDSSGHLYVQRPTRAEYIQGIKEGKASGDPELFALAKVVGKNIELKTPDGVVKTFTPDGKVSVSNVSSNRPDTISLDLERNDETGIGHIKGATKSTGYDCLYEVVLDKAGLKGDIESLRTKTADELEKSGRQFYHEWSLQSGEKEFMGRGLPAIYEIGKGLMISQSLDKLGDAVKTLGEKADVLWYVGGQTMMGMSEYAGALALIPLTSGTAAFVSGLLITDGSDRLSSAYLSLSKMEKENTLFSKGLQATFKLSPEKAEWYHDMFGMVIDAGPVLMMRGGKYIIRDLPAMARSKKEEIKLLVQDFKNCMSPARTAQTGVILTLPMVKGEVPNQKRESFSGQFQLDDIINPHQKKVTNRTEIFAPDGRALMLKDDGSFSFIELQNSTKK